ncbi:hypothetical protein [Streptomyces sp. BK79]|uniref:hypothetical protein n=1 Tax=Streptomyces sp. BK79 TaxID=3350097 RepID=UPI0037704FDF
MRLTHTRGSRTRRAPAPIPRALTLATLACSLSLATACGTSGPDGPGSPAASRETAAATTRQPLSPADLCVTAVQYWAREIMDGATPYGDYQSMGLSNRQYDVLREVVAAARTARREQGSAAAERLIAHQARETCADRYRDGGPADGPWR